MKKKIKKKINSHSSPIRFSLSSPSLHVLSSSLSSRSLADKDDSPETSQPDGGSHPPDMRHPGARVSLASEPSK
ncbi:hypothetical protein E2C01_040493 [Portunus trituberculatus]|uniref:Uncharacterized protein n=1 Tax=Portunus trituberculatus TaxID=210409 RepID=A0A5B7FN59_PORTR|nr:hypothetical protein [Portunus trituberculatus]